MMEGMNGNSPSIGFSSNVKVLCRILGELLEEHGQERINVFARGLSARDLSRRVRISNIDRLVKEYNGRVGIPRIRVLDGVDLRVDGCGTKLHKEPGQRGAPRATVKPQDYGVVLGVIT